MLRKLSLICAVVAVLFVPATPTFAMVVMAVMDMVVMGMAVMGTGTAVMVIGVAVMVTGMVVMVIGMVATGAAMDGAVGGVQASASMSAAIRRRCWDPYYGYYPCRYRWGY